jgi:pimeloyl-ACP methyl ester carboxylesterase
MNHENIRIKNNRGKSISGRLYRAGPADKRMVIFCHGLLSTQDGYKISRMRDDILNWGFALFTFDFSFSGESEDVFFNLSVEQEVLDLKYVFNYLASTGIDDLHIIGSSMGGTVSLIAASRDRLFQKKSLLKSLVTIASPIDLCGLVRKLTGIENPDALEVNGATEIDGVAVNNRFYKEMCETDILQSINKIEVPLLSFHGDADETVDRANLDLIREHLTSPGKQVIIEGGDHSLSSSNHLNILKDHIREWLAGFY